MRFRWAATHRTASLLTSPPAAPLRFALLLLLASATASQLLAQATPRQPQPYQPGYTLHVYVNLMQIPTLVLSPSLSPLPPISLDKFNISLDSGPRFHPTHIRLEGDDPIDLAILLDLSGDTYNLQTALIRSLPAFLNQSLQPHDHVSIFAIDCLFVGTPNDIPVTDGDRIAHALDAAISFPQLHGVGEKGPHCGSSIHLWNALGTVAESIGNLPGRRVILVVSNGRDQKSSVHWTKLRRYAAARSITLFGLYPTPLVQPLNIRFGLSTEDPFNILCQLTGGLVLFTSPSEVSNNLKRTIDFVRGRYILEFPRPDSDNGGDHNIDVTLRKMDAFIRPAGISYLSADPSIATDPTTLPSPPSPAVFGTRRPLNPPQ
jgi:hypothetical protein